METKTENKIIKGFKDQELFCNVWDKVENPEGVLLIVHGMQEHSGRYKDFASYLNQNNIIVYATDLRCHGKTCGDVKKLGHTDTDVFDEIVQDQVIILHMLNEKYNLPVYLLGHSFGSFIAQKLVQESSDWQKAIFSGTAYTKTFLIGAGLQIANLTALLKGKHATAKLVEKMSFGAYGKKFKNGNWLSRDENIFTKYKKDEFCGTPFTAGFYQSMFGNMLRIPNGFSKIPKDKPLLIIAGGSDPVGESGKLPQRLHEELTKLELDCTLQIFPEARHEVLNETNKNEIWKVVLDFIKK